MRHESAASVLIDCEIIVQMTKDGRRKVTEIRQCCKQLRETGVDCVLNRLRQIEKGQSVPNDTLTALLRNYYNEHGKLLNEDLERLVDEFITIFIAGHETTAGTMSFVLWLTDKHRQVKEK